jgi:hypothetical protein
MEPTRGKDEAEVPAKQQGNPAFSTIEEAL